MNAGLATWSTAARFALRIPRFAGMGLIRLYQWTVSPLLGPRCKYYPSCSHYGYTAVERHGLVKGSLLTAWRILRCNPWSHGGVDDVPVRGAHLFHRPMNSGFARSTRRAVTT